jgi:hypothetical protein
MEIAQSGRIHEICQRIEQIAIELTHVVAIATAGRFVALTHRPPHGAGNPLTMFLLQRLPITNEQNCDYEDNSIRACFIA